MTKSSNSASTDTVELVELKFPSMYNVVIHNDNTTPYDLVVFILVECVELDKVSAVKKTHEAHEQGSAVVGTFTKEVAEEILSIATETASMNGYPEFTLTMEKDDE